MDDEGQDVAAAEAALEGAFGNAKPVAKPAPRLPTQTQHDINEIVDAVIPPEDAAPGDDDPAPSGDEPSYEIEVSGQKETVRGKDQIVELLQKGSYFSKGTEEVARVREALTAQIKAQQDVQHFAAAVIDDVADVKALQQQLAQYDKVDWNTAIDQDYAQAMKWQAQRTLLREQLATKVNQIQQKHNQHRQAQAQANAQVLAAEQSALLAKLPEWRNSEKANAERETIVRELAHGYGFNPDELASLMDHRMVLVARDAMRFRALQASKDERLKQVREAPPVSKPGSIATQQPATGKAGFDKFTKEFRAQGRKGNNRAQDELLTRAFNRAFK